MNKCVLMGRLCADPELKQANSGTSIANFRLAVTRSMKNKDGEYESDFLPCIAFGKTAEFVQKYFTKGRRMLVEGSIQTRTWDDKEGTKHYATEIICNGVEFADSKPDAGNPAPAPAAKSSAKASKYKAPETFEPVGSDDDLPF